ncbi:MAG: hypothetical protein U0L68_06050 [Prevotellamassilia sp.]|nr:hypothetical protein [Prevotellamassilia sp.]
MPWNPHKETMTLPYFQEKSPRLKIYFPALKKFFQALKKNFQALEKFFQGMAIFLEIMAWLRSALSV